MKKKSKSKEEAQHAYRVVYHQWDEVKVEKFKITAATKTHVTYINDYGVEFTIEKIGVSFRWFKTKKRANAFAVEKLKDRVSFYSDMVKRLERQIQKINSSK